MSAVLAAEPQVLHAIPGRVRLRLPDWSGQGQRALEKRIQQVQGVLSARANSLTGTVLVCFDPAAVDMGAIVAELRSLVPLANSEGKDSPQPDALREHEGHQTRARISIPGMDRNPALARRVVDQLQKQPGVTRVAASVLTGRVLVEFDRRVTTIDDVLAEVTHVELPDLPGEDNPTHPLDPRPLILGTARSIGSGLGLGLLAAQRLTGLQPPADFREGGIRLSAALGILSGFPFIRHGLRRLFGREGADLALSFPTILALTLAGSPLGLSVTAVESFRLLTEVLARRAAWKRYEKGLESVASAHPGATVRCESGERTPLPCTVLEGFGTAVARCGLPEGVEPGKVLPAGARLHGGPFVLELQGGEAFEAQLRPAPIRQTVYERYLHALSPISLGYAALTGLLTRSLSRAFQALLLVGPRTALIGKEFADLSASARVLRTGVIVVGTREQRLIRRPDYLLIGDARVLSEGLEVASAMPLKESSDASRLLSRASEVAAAAGSPWGGVLAAAAGPSPAAEGNFDGREASASIGGVRYSLCPVSHRNEVPAEARLRARGEHLLVLREQSGARSKRLGLVALRPRLAGGVAALVDTCRGRGVRIVVLSGGQPAAVQALCNRAQVEMLDIEETPQAAVQAIRTLQQDGSVVAYASDSAEAAAAFDACDLAIGVTSGRTGHFPARADLLAPDLHALASIVEAGSRRDAAVRDSVAFSTAANLFGAVWGLRGAPGIARASYAVYATSLAAMAAAWARLRGGERPWSSIARLVDPRPERWGRRTPQDILSTLQSSPDGLTSAQALERRQVEPLPGQRNGVLSAILDQIRSPLTGILAAGATLSFILGSYADVVMIAATISANILVGAWQERQAGQAIAALQRIGASSARVLRDGRPAMVPTGDIVPGDILVLAPGDRVAADARLIDAQGLEVDEAALTGESLPVAKADDGPTDASRIVLAGSDVTVGTGRAVVVAVGRRTRMGATAAALAIDETRASPLGVRLNRMLRQILPLAAAGGLVVVLSGLLRRRPLLSQFAIGASIAIAAVPEGLPLLAGVGEAAVARRLGDRRALVRRLSAVEALGRVDVACTDKTGTLTEGHLALRVVASLDGEADPKEIRPDTDCGHSQPGTRLRRVLLTAGLATPHPDAADAAAHPTDIAVAEGARTAGLGDALHAERREELPFDPARSFHAALIGDRLCLKGASEELVPRCSSIRIDDEVRPLDGAGREEILARAQSLAERGLRVLMVAEGPSDAVIEDPEGLTALGFLGIADPLRPEVAAAVQRCHAAGVRVIMLTGDHPATARAIGREAGLLDGGGAVLTGSDIAQLQNDKLDRRLEEATVIARVTPIDKLRIVESLKRSGHTVAMTGDGVNDAPALRLADVGVAMGRGGTEVARQAADVVLADDDFSTLVEALVEGRSFWRNIRRALALLLGGNLGELGLVVSASALGLASPLLTRQILAVNMVTDVLPSLAVALQPPESRNLAALAREGTAALDRPLRRDIWRRGAATAGPSLVAYLLALRSSGLPEARSVAFGSIVATQLAQTLDVGRVEGSLTRSVFGAVVGSAGVLVAALTFPPLRNFLSLATPSPGAWAIVAAAALAGALVGRLSRPSLPSPRLRLLPVSAAAR
jgi:calcium-translocating P-type ATPase